MRLAIRFTLPSIQTAIAIVVTMSIFSRPLSFERPLVADFGLNLGYAVNGPATVLRYFLESFAMQCFPEKYEHPWRGWYPLSFIFETFVYFGFVWLLWYAVALEATGKGQSVLTPRTGRRGLADALTILFGVLVGVFGLLGHSMGSPIRSLLVGVTYVLWAMIFIVFYGHDLWIHFRTRQERNRLANARE